MNRFTKFELNVDVPLEVNRDGYISVSGNGNDVRQFMMEAMAYSLAMPNNIYTFEIRDTENEREMTPTEFFEFCYGPEGRKAGIYCGRCFEQLSTEEIAWFYAMRNNRRVK